MEVGCPQCRAPSIGPAAGEGGQSLSVSWNPSSGFLLEPLTSCRGRAAVASVSVCLGCRDPCTSGGGGPARCSMCGAGPEVLLPAEAGAGPARWAGGGGGLRWGAGDQFSAQAASLAQELGLLGQVALGIPAGREALAAVGQPRGVCAGHRCAPICLWIVCVACVMSRQVSCPACLGACASLSPPGPHSWPPGLRRATLAPGTLRACRPPDCPRSVLTSQVPPNCHPSFPPGTQPSLPAPDRAEILVQPLVPSGRGRVGTHTE